MSQHTHLPNGSVDGFACRTSPAGGGQSGNGGVSLHRLQTFTSTLAHEIRQPLSGLRAAVEVLQMSHDSELSDRTTTLMRRQVDQMQRMVDDILDATRLAHGKVTVCKKRIDARDVIRDAVADLRSEVASRQQDVFVAIGGAPLWVDGDRQRLYQVFSNLLSNAVKYTPSGGRITVTAELMTGAITIRVRDTGLGIAPEVLSQVFDLFAQADSSLVGSLGMGLSVVREIVGLHQGHVEAWSEGVSHGSEFRVTLPRAGAPISRARTWRLPPPGAPIAALMDLPRQVALS